MCQNLNPCSLILELMVLTATQYFLFLDLCLEGIKHIPYCFILYIGPGVNSRLFVLPQGQRDSYYKCQILLNYIFGYLIKLQFFDFYSNLVGSKAHSKTSLNNEERKPEMQEGCGQRERECIIMKLRGYHEMEDSMAKDDVKGRSLEKQEGAMKK